MFPFSKITHSSPSFLSINIKQEQKGKAYLVDGKVICNIHSEIKDFQVVNKKVLAMRFFSLGCTKGSKNEEILGYLTQKDNRGDGNRGDGVNPTPEINEESAVQQVK